MQGLPTWFLSFRSSSPSYEHPNQNLPCLREDSKQWYGCRSPEASPRAYRQLNGQTHEHNQRTLHPDINISVFRIDFTGTPVTSVVNESQFSFTIKRYADLLMDTYISLRLPAIWSPIEPPRLIPNTTNKYSGWIPYEFQWCFLISEMWVDVVQLQIRNSTKNRSLLCLIITPTVTANHNILCRHFMAVISIPKWM